MPPRRRKAEVVEEPVEIVEEEIDEVDDDTFEELDDEDTDEDVEEVEDDDLDEVEEVEEEAPAPKATRGKKAAAAKKTTTAKAAPKVQGSGNDSVWLASVVTKNTNKTVDSRGIRVLLRKLAKEGVLPRVIGEDRGRYDFPNGTKDPVVIEVIKRVKAGALDVAKGEGLAAARAAKARKAAENQPPAPKATPAKNTAKKTTAKAAPAKATKRTRAKA